MEWTLQCWRGRRSFRLPLCGGHDGVHHLDDPVQGRVGADGHVGAAEVVVDGADHADDVELRVASGRLLIDEAWKTARREGFHSPDVTWWRALDALRARFGHASGAGVDPARLTLSEELVQQAAPLLPEEVGAGQAAVAADHAQVVDAALHQVARGPQAALADAELFAAGAADDRAALGGGGGTF